MNHGGAKTMRVSSIDLAAPHSPHALPGWGLSRREVEVADWLLEGKTNSEIAIILGMSARTAEKHVEHILGKLGVENRTAAALALARARNGFHEPASLSAGLALGTPALPPT
jgi:DNA-binding CsgD family transcriptional regulator